MKKRMFILALCLSVPLALMAGGKGEKTGGAQAAASLGAIQPGTEIVVWHAMGGAAGGAFEAIIKDYNETAGKQLGVTVTGVFQGTEITSKLKLAAQQNDLKNVPDISQTVGGDITTVLALPFTVKAEDLFKSPHSKIKKTDYYEPFLRTYTYGNELAGVPISTSTILLYYNADALKAAGFSGPPATIDEMARMIPALTSKSGGAVNRYGLITSADTGQSRFMLVNFLVSQFPESFVGDNEGGRAGPMTKVTIDTDGTLVKFLNEWKKIVDSGGYNPRSANINEEFATGVGAMAIMSSSRIGAIQRLVGNSFNFQTAPLPKVNASDTSGASVGGASLVVYSHNDPGRLAAAWSFVEYATSPEVQLKWSQATGYIPVHKEVENLPAMRSFYAANPQFKVPLDQMKASSPLAQEPLDMVMWQVDTIIRDLLIQFAEGKLPVQQTAQEIVKQYNSALADYNRANR
jgi:sn-glycerol 3-phosphate transport system substrate-binding protein